MTSIAAALDRLTCSAHDGRLASLCRRFDLDLFVVFGSASRGDSRQAEPADLDVAVRFASYAPTQVLPLLDVVSELAGIDTVDLMVLNRAGPVARERALVGCLLLYEGGAGVFANAQIAAIMERMDTEWFRRLELELLQR